MQTPTIDQQIACVDREIALRERVYPRWIEAGRMTKEKANHEIACMKEVLKVMMAYKSMQPLRQ